MYDERQREWTPEQLAEAAKDAVDNWEWDVYLSVGGEEGRDNRKAIIEAMTDPDYCRSSYADDDGIIRIEPQFGNVWSWLDERMESSYGSYLATKEYYG